MKKLGILLAGCMLLLGLATTAGAYQVFSSGPLDSSFPIDFFIDNDGPGVINSVEFSLGSPLVFGGLVGLPTGPAGGTATLFTVPVLGVDAKFGFNFTSFDVGDSFSFGWDPDTVTDPDFGAVIGDLAGTVVSLFATEGKYCGQMVIDPTGNHLVTDLSCFTPAPLPGSLLLLGSGLLGLVGFRCRKS